MAVASGQMGIHFGEKDLALGLDPGRDKTGFAIVRLDGTLMISGIFPTVERDKFFGTEDFSEWTIESLCSEFDINKIRIVFIGNGTGGREFFDYVRERVKGCRIILVDESNTTLEARKLYWTIHKPSLLSRILPESLRVPKRPLDDLAALSLTLRALRKYSII